MGVGIYWYSGLAEFADVASLDPDFFNDPEDGGSFNGDSKRQLVQLNANSDFPGYEGELRDKTIYHYESNGRACGTSYSWYNKWRNGLAQLIGMESAKEVWDLAQTADMYSSYITETPFYRLIHFSNCEGFIGYPHTEKLYKDFQDYAEKAKTHLDEDWQDFYLTMKKAFEKAANHGAIDFC